MAGAGVSRLLERWEYELLTGGGDSSFILPSLGGLILKGAPYCLHSAAGSPILGQHKPSPDTAWLQGLGPLIGLSAHRLSLEPELVGN